PIPLRLDRSEWACSSHRTPRCECGHPRLHCGCSPRGGWLVREPGWLGCPYVGLVHASEDAGWVENHSESVSLARRGAQSGGLISGIVSRGFCDARAEYSTKNPGIVEADCGLPRPKRAHGPALGGE